MNKIEQIDKVDMYIEKVCSTVWKGIVWFGMLNFAAMLVRFAWALYLGKI